MTQDQATAEDARGGAPPSGEEPATTEDVLRVRPDDPQAVQALKRMLGGLVREDWDAFAAPVHESIAFSALGMGEGGEGKAAYIDMSQRLRRSFLVGKVTPERIFGDDELAVAQVVIACGWNHGTRFDTRMAILVRVTGGRQYEAHYYTNQLDVVRGFVRAYALHLSLAAAAIAAGLIVALS